jgi:hypothetical protein
MILADLGDLPGWPLPDVHVEPLDNRQVLKLTEIRSCNFWKNSLSESIGSSKYIGVGISRARQILVLPNVEQVEGKMEERSQKIVGKPNLHTNPNNRHGQTLGESRLLNDPTPDARLRGTPSMSHLMTKTSELTQLPDHTLLVSPETHDPGISQIVSHIECIRVCSCMR